MKHLKTFESYSLFEGKEAQKMPSKAQVQKEVEASVKSKLSKLDEEELEDLMAALKKVKGQLNESAIFEGKELQKKTLKEKIANAITAAGLSGALASTVMTAIAAAQAVGPEMAEKMGDAGMVPAALAGLGISALITVIGQMLGKKA